MNGQHIGYKRVSTIEQSTDRQLVDVKLDRVFEDKLSGTTANRPKLKACLDHLRQGDTLHVHSIDRLARNMADLLQIVNDLTSEGVTVHFSKEALTFSGGDSPIDKLMLQMLAAFSEFEVSMIKSRQREGIAAAKGRGVRFGAKPKLTTEQVNAIRSRASQGEAKKALALEFGVSRQTLYTALANTG
jgi:DNA invertase Pin-like site-specific DNA recombinase